MLTLKVITTDVKDNRITYLLTGERISYRKWETNDRKIDYGCLVLGDIDKDKISDQPFEVVCINLSDGEYNKEDDIVILPLAQCFIMENGKTVDSFSCIYK